MYNILADQTLNSQSDSGAISTSAGCYGQITKISATMPFVGKRYTIVDGVLTKDTSANISEAQGVTVRYNSIQELAEVLDAIAATPNEAVVLGTTRFDSFPIVASKARNKKFNAVSRTKEFFKPAAVFTLCFDIDNAATLPTAEAAHKFLVTNLPFLAGRQMVIRSSSSAFLRNAETGEVFSEGTGWHCYVPAMNVTEEKLVAFRKSILPLLWSADEANVFGLLGRKNSATGVASVLIRSLIDPSVFDATRIMFEGSLLEGSVESWAPASLIIDGTTLDFVDRSSFAASQVINGFESWKKREKRRLTGQQVETLVEHLVTNEGVLSQDAEVIAVDRLRSWNRGEIPQTHMVNTMDGVMSVLELAQRVEATGKMMHCADPADPKDDLRVCCLSPGFETLFSHANGGVKYRILGYTAPRKRKTKLVLVSNVTHDGDVYDEHIHVSGRFDEATIQNISERKRCLIIVNAGMGVGKTQSVAKQLTRKAKPAHTLAITPRISLLENLCANAETLKDQTVCINSVAKLFKASLSASLMIYDEAFSSYAEMFISSTMHDQREDRFGCFWDVTENILTNDGNLVFLEDAGSEIAKADVISRARRMGFSIILLTSDYVHPRKQLKTIFKDQNTQEKQVLNAIATGLRTIWLNTSKEAANTAAVRAYHAVTGRTLSIDMTYEALCAELLSEGIALITADTPHTLCKEFIADPDAWLAQQNLRVLVSSPVLESGFSINQKHFDLRALSFTCGKASSAIQMAERYRVDVPTLTFVSRQHMGSSDETAEAVEKSRERKMALISDNKICTSEFSKLKRAFKAESNKESIYRRELFVENQLSKGYNLAFNDDKATQGTMMKARKKRARITNDLIHSFAQLMTQTIACCEDTIQTYLESRDDNKRHQARKAILVKAIGAVNAENEEFIFLALESHKKRLKGAQALAMLFELEAHKRNVQYSLDNLGRRSQDDVKLGDEVANAVTHYDQTGSIGEIIMTYASGGATSIRAKDDDIISLANFCYTFEEEFTAAGLVFSKDITTLAGRFLARFGIRSERATGADAGSSFVDGKQCKDRIIRHVEVTWAIAEHIADKMRSRDRVNSDRQALESSYAHSLEIPAIGTPPATEMIQMVLSI